MKKNMKHIIFDCFGTLIDTGNGSIKAMKQILSNVDVCVDAKSFYSDWKKAKREMMNAAEFINEKKLFELSLAETFVKYGIDADPAEEVKPMIQSLFSERIVFPEVKMTLLQLSEKGLDIAIGSTTDTDSLMHSMHTLTQSIPRIPNTLSLSAFPVE